MYGRHVGELGEEVGQGGDLVPGGGGTETEDDDAGEPRRRVASDVRKVEVEGDKDSLLLVQGAGDIGVGAAGELLVVDGEDVVAQGAQGGGDVGVDVLVELELHEGRVRGRTRSWASLAP